MNQRERSDFPHLYSEAVVRNYRAGVVAFAHSAARAYAGSARWWSTCKPLSRSDPPEGRATPSVTRTRRFQTALDSMARSGLVGAPRLVRGLIDNTALLSGFEHYARDGRHYTGKGAVTMLNGHLNELFGA